VEVDNGSSGVGVSDGSLHWAQSTAGLLAPELLTQ
jgi:hypothetical protein